MFEVSLTDLNWIKLIILYRKNFQNFCIFQNITTFSFSTFFPSKQTLQHWGELSNQKSSPKLSSQWHETHFLLLFNKNPICSTLMFSFSNYIDNLIPNSRHPYNWFTERFFCKTFNTRYIWDAEIWVIYLTWKAWIVFKHCSIITLKATVTLFPNPCNSIWGEF